SSELEPQIQQETEVLPESTVDQTLVSADAEAEEPADAVAENPAHKPAEASSQVSVEEQSPAAPTEATAPDAAPQAGESQASSSATTEAAAAESRPPQADSIDLKQVVTELETPVHEAVPETPSPEPSPEPITPPRVILGVEVPAGTSTRLIWTPDDVASGFADRTPILVVNGRNPGKTLCLTGAVHGDELNGIEMIRRIMYQLEPEKVSGTVIGVPVVNLMGFRRSTRYLPD